MTLGLSISAFTTLHVIISLIAIAAGLVFVYELARDRWLGQWNLVFLVTTILTSVTGFMLPFVQFGPPHIFGIVSLVALAIMLYALYGRRLAGAWRTIYIVGAFLTLYLNLVVLVVQSFQKIGFLIGFAPTQSEPPFLAVQLIVLAATLWFGYQSVRKFHPPRFP